MPERRRLVWRALVWRSRKKEIVPSEGGRSLAFRGLALAFLVVASACATSRGQSVSTSPTISKGEAFPVSVRAANGVTRIAEKPNRVVSLSPTGTEMLFAIDAGDQVVAVDQDSNYPPQAPTTELSGYQPNVEAIAGYNPDLVVISDDGGLVKSLEKLSIPVLLEPAATTLDDSYAQIEQLGAATGRVAEAAHLVATMKSEIEEAAASAPTFDHPLTYYHELDQTYYTATSITFIGQIYGLLGLRNIGDEAKGAANGYPQLSAEYIIKADPDMIFLSDTKCCGQSASTVAQRPGWDEITAVKDGAVISLDDDIASRWGPRVVDFVQTVVGALSRLRARVRS